MKPRVYSLKRLTRLNDLYSVNTLLRERGREEGRRQRERLNKIIIVEKWKNYNLLKKFIESQGDIFKRSVSLNLKILNKWTHLFNRNQTKKKVSHSGLNENILQNLSRLNTWFTVGGPFREV